VVCVGRCVCVCCVCVCVACVWGECVVCACVCVVCVVYVCGVCVCLCGACSCACVSTRTFARVYVCVCVWVHLRMYGHRGNITALSVLAAFRHNSGALNRQFVQYQNQVSNNTYGHGTNSTWSA